MAPWVAEMLGLLRPERRLAFSFIDHNYWRGQVNMTAIILSGDSKRSSTPAKYIKPRLRQPQNGPYLADPFQNTYPIH